jgi:hypothetical protein
MEGDQFVMTKRLVECGHDQNVVDKFLRVLRRSEMETIDEFIEAHSRDEGFRRAALQAVALLISDCEIDDALYPIDRHPWYKRLLRFLQKNPELAHRDRLNFLTFNYDRSIEHYLQAGISSSGNRFPAGTVENFLNKNFLHIHGHLGKLPWQGGTREYGVAPSAEQLKEIGNGMLAPYQEVTLSGEDLERLRSSDLVVFLGFAFHPQNLGKIDYSGMLNRKDLPMCTTVQALEMDRRTQLENTPLMSMFETDCDNLVSFLLLELEKNRRGGTYKVSEDWLKQHRRIRV